MHDVVKRMLIEALALVGALCLAGPFAGASGLAPVLDKALYEIGHDYGGVAVEMYAEYVNIDYARF